MELLQEKKNKQKVYSFSRVTLQSSFNCLTKYIFVRIKKTKDQILRLPEVCLGTSRDRGQVAF